MRINRKNESVEKICILASPDKSKRFNHSGLDVPKWFSLPLEQLCKTYFTETLPKIRNVSGKKGFLIFNISWREVFVALLYGRWCPICSLFQWVPLEKLSWIKYFCYRIVLKHSKVIVTYNQIAYDYIKKHYPKKKVFFLKLWVDTDFFKPCDSHTSVGRFLLCPGSHRRNEAMVCKLAKSLGIPIVRFSQDSEAISYYKKNPCDLVDFRYNISYEEMRQLYNDASAVLNIVDDRQIPAGLTCFVESLAMDCTVITPSGHSSAGYQFNNGKKPYYTVSESAGFEEWKQVIETALEKPITNGLARQYAEQYASLEAARKLWHEVLDNMNMTRD
jgi:glycosyltransferase involved in cell wall biosynthesis